MKRLGLLLILGIIAGLLLPVNIGVEANITTLSTGTKIVVDNGMEVTYLGKTADGDTKWRATIGTPAYLDDLKTPINCQWGYDLNNTQWYAKDNLFTAIVKDGRVTVEYQNNRVSWQPQFEVKGVAQAEGYASLLPTDPINENYYGNTLQWNYGNGITRNVRLIEGMLIEYYTIAKIPGGDITIKTNVSKDAGFVWTRPAVAWDSATLDNSVDLKINGDDITLTLDAMKGATFPITIDPDLTFTGAEMDATLANTEVGNVSPEQEWGDVRNDTTSSDNWIGPSGTVAVAGKNASGTYTAVCYRPVLYFDTEGVPDDCNVTNVTLRLRGTDAAVQTEMGVWHMVIQNGMSTYPHEPPVKADYYYTYYSGNGGNISSDDMGAGYKDIYLSPDGLGWINKTGVTKFILREEEHDINDTLISYDDGAYNTSQWIFYLYEQGVGYEPELIVYYEASAAPTIITKNATYVAATTARLNSYITSDGGEACDVRFIYSTVSGGGGAGTFENFTTYTEVDTEGIIDLVGTDHIDFDAWCNESAYLYYDYTAGYFDDFVHLIDINATADEEAHATFWMLANDLGDSYDLEDNAKTYIGNHLLWNNAVPNNITLYLMESYGGSTYTDTYTATVGTKYFLTNTKSGTTLTCAIYPNASRVTPLHTLDLTLHADHTFQYVYAVATHDYGDPISIDPITIDNLTLEGNAGWTNTSWVNDTYWQGDSPYADIVNLTSNVTYYFKAQIRNSEGISSGAERSFTAGISETPVNLTAYPTSHNVSLTWTKGADTTNTMVRGQIGAFPTSATDGQLVYFGTMSTAVHEGLSPGFSYFYRAYGESGGNYTANYTETVATTSAGAAAGDVPGAAEMPSVWYGAPDHTRLSGVPFYGMINDLADEYGMPPTNFWLLLMLFAASLMGLFVYRVSHSGVVGIIGGGVTLTILLGSLGGLLWIVFAVAMIVTGVFVVVRRV